MFLNIIFNAFEIRSYYNYVYLYIYTSIYTFILFFLLIFKLYFPVFFLFFGMKYLHAFVLSAKLLSNNFSIGKVIKQFSSGIVSVWVASRLPVARAACGAGPPRRGPCPAGHRDEVPAPRRGPRCVNWTCLIITHHVIFV